MPVCNTQRHRRCIQKPALRRLTTLLGCGILVLSGCGLQRPLAARLPGSASMSPRERHLSRALRNYEAGQLDQALAAVDRALKADPNSTQARELEALLHSDLGHRDAYVAALRQVVSANPQSAPELCSAGRLLVVAGHRAEGLAAIQRAVQLAPHETAYARELASVYLNAGEMATAAAVLAAAHSRNPRDPSLPLALARIHEAAGDWPHALEYYNLVLQHDPDNAAWRRQRAKCLYRTGQFSRAAADFQRCLETDVAALTATDRIEYGDACLRIGDYPRAQWLFDRLAADGVDTREIATLRGVCALRSNDARQAEQIFAEALRRWPDDPSLALLLNSSRQAASGVVPASGVAPTR